MTSIDYSKKELEFMAELFGEMIDGTGEESYEEMLKSIFEKTKKALNQKRG